MSEPRGTLSNQIAASSEDVKALLEDNYHLSIAFLSRRIQDVEKDVREGFRALDRGRDKRLVALEDDVKKLQERLQMASVKFKEMREELDQVKGRLDLDKSVQVVQEGVTQPITNQRKP